MEISFRKLPDNQHEVLVRGRKGPDVRLPAQPVGPTMPHDLVHAVVETALGIDDGFWGAMARGATFQGFEFLTPTRHRRSGLKVLRRGGDAVMAAEMSVNWAYRVWRGLPTEGRAVGRAPHRRGRPRQNRPPPRRSRRPLDSGPGGRGAAVAVGSGPLNPARAGSSWGGADRTCRPRQPSNAARSARPYRREPAAGVLPTPGAACPRGLQLHAPDPARVGREDTAPRCGTIQPAQERGSSSPSGAS
ncbi:hypothetical protein GCM10020256_36600 [Streptomyces thermocoprophilus]